MKKYKRYMLTACLYVVSLCPIYGATHGENLFPVATGLSGYVVASQVNIRTFPGEEATIVDQVSLAPLKVVGKNNGWYKVNYNGKEGWIYDDFVIVSHESLIPYVKISGEDIVSYGLQFIGTPYVWGGNDLKKGVDCSGFTQGVYEAFDIPLSRVSYMQAEDGRDIAKEHLQTGDLVFFDTEGINDGNVSHVGIYMGDGQFIHSDSDNGVMVSALSNSYYTRNYVKGVRLW